MKMSKCQYRIGDLAKQLNVEKFVIRFWEKELGIKPKRSKGGQRFYQEKDFQTFATVKNLLYEKKYTLAGAKEELVRMKTKKQQKPAENIIATQKTSLPSEHQKKLLSLKSQLLKFKLHLLT